MFCKKLKRKKEITMGKIQRLKYWFYIKLRKYKYWKRRKETVAHDPKKCSYGKENPDKTFYVARRFSEVEGHCSMLMTMLGHFYLADRMGMIPVVDMKNHYSELWQEREKRGLENSWEYFYEQPAGYTLDDIAKSKKIFLSDGVHARKTPSYRTTCDSQEEIAFWNKIYNKFVHLNQKTKEIVNNELNVIDVKEKKLIAVSIRRGIEWGHLVKDKGFECYYNVPSVMMILENTRRLKEEWGCDGVFLTIDDEEGLELFKKEFGKNLYYIKRDRRKYFIDGKPNPVAEKGFQPKESIYDREVKYLSELFVVSKCDYFIGTRSSTTLGALVIKGEKFRNTYLYGE